MKLRSITKTNYNNNEDLTNLTIERFIREMREEGVAIASSFYNINESTNSSELNELQLQEGIRDILKIGAQKFGSLFKNLKGASDQVIQKAAADVQSRLATSGKESAMAALSKFAKKNANYAKPALIMAVLGASLLGMDTASANDMISGMDSLGGAELDAAFGDYGLDPVGHEGGSVDGSQAPREDTPKEYNTGAEGAPSMQERIQAIKYDVAKDSIGQKVGNYTITQNDVLDTIKNGKFAGNQNMSDYITDIMSEAPSTDAGVKMVKREFNQALMDILQKRGV